MLKRTLIAGMWFFALASLGGALSAYLAVPRTLMLLPAVGGSVTVWYGLASYERWRATRSMDGAVNHVVTRATVGARAMEGLTTDPVV